MGVFGWVADRLMREVMPRTVDRLIPSDPSQPLHPLVVEALRGRSGVPGLERAMYRVEWTDEDGTVHSIYEGADGGRAVELWEGCCASNLVGELRFLDAIRGERGHVVKR